MVAGGGVFVDLRSPSKFAAGHIPGSLSIPAGSSFATWLGWVVDLERPVVFLLPGVDAWDEAIRQALVLTNRFRKEENLILVSTDAAAEGLNLPQRVLVLSTIAAVKISLTMSHMPLMTESIC